MIQLDLIFVKDIRSVMRFMVLPVDVQLFPHQLLLKKKKIHFYWTDFSLSFKVSWLNLFGSISVISILLRCLSAYLLANTTPSWYYICIASLVSFPGGSEVKKICLPMGESQEMWIWSLGWETFQILSVNINGTVLLIPYSDWLLLVLNLNGMCH